MATRTRTRKAIEDSTAIVMASDILSNRPALPDLDDILAVANEGTHFKTQADLLNGRAVQSVAYSIMALWTTWSTLGHPTHKDVEMEKLPLAQILYKSGADIKSQLRELFIEALAWERTDIKDVQNDKGAGIALNDQSRIGLFGRALNMAAILVACGVTYADFNRKLHCFAVAPALLIPPGHTVLPNGRLANSKEPILLNRQTLGLINEKESFVKIYASVDQLNKASRARMKIKPSRNPKSPVALKDMPAERISAECDLAVVITALNKMFVTTKQKSKLDFASLPLPIWNMLSDIAAQSQEIQESEPFKLWVRTGISQNVTIEGTAMEVDTAA